MYKNWLHAYGQSQKGFPHESSDSVEGDCGERLFSVLYNKQTIYNMVAMDKWIKMGEAEEKLIIMSEGFNRSGKLSIKGNPHVDWNRWKASFKTYLSTSGLDSAEEKKN